MPGPNHATAGRHPLMRVATLAGALVAAAALAACGGSDGSDTGASATTASTESSFALVAPAQAAALLASTPEAVVLDVRTPAEFAEEHLAGALLIDYQSADFRDKVADLDRDLPYVVYCHSGNRSAGAVKVLRELGFHDVTEVGGGITAWTEAGLPVVTG